MPLSFTSHSSNNTATERHATALHSAVLHAVEQHLAAHQPRYHRMHAYYTNALTPALIAEGDAGSSRPYRQAQEWGLPARITGRKTHHSAAHATPFSSAYTTAACLTHAASRKEVVIENDIGWRIDTQMAYLLGSELRLQSAARDPRLAASITRLMQLIVARHGGHNFYQQLALLGSIFGHVDVLVKLTPAALAYPGDGPDPIPPADDPAADAPAAAGDDNRLQALAECISLEIIDPRYGIPILDAHDYRIVRGYAVLSQVSTAAHAATSSSATSSGAASTAARQSWWRKWSRLVPHTQPAVQQLLDVITPALWQRFEQTSRGDYVLVDSRPHALGQVPLVHIQNQMVPLSYSGLSDVEPLIPLQDELNTRLSDRGHRLAMQSFRMYLGKGIDNFDQISVGPGRLWITDNTEAEVQEFGGDASAPSEEAHFADIRSALDKASSVSPVAAGVLRQKVGNLTSAAALRLTMQALIAKTHRKRLTYGAGISQIGQLALAWLDVAGLLRTQPQDRALEVRWPPVVPEDPTEQLAQAEAKLRLGIRPETVLKELGYAG